MEPPWPPFCYAVDRCDTDVVAGLTGGDHLFLLVWSEVGNGLNVSLARIRAAPVLREVRHVAPYFARAPERSAASVLLICSRLVGDVQAGLAYCRPRNPGILSFRDIPSAISTL